MFSFLNKSGRKAVDFSILGTDMHSHLIPGIDDGAKTFVETGAEMSKDASTGQHKAAFSEKAKNEKETAERIAQGIQLAEKFAKDIELPKKFNNKSELIKFINEEAKKLSELI